MGHIGNSGIPFSVAQNISLLALLVNIKTPKEQKKKDDYLTYKAENPFTINAPQWANLMTIPDNFCQSL